MSRHHAAWLPAPARFAAGVLLAVSLAVPGMFENTPAGQSGIQLVGPDLVVLVRHAEKAAEPASDPPLSPDGAERARELARVLADAGITRIHSSDTRRTRDTAGPLAAALGIEIELYDPRDLSAMASRLRSLPGRHLVVGHSNTTDALSAAMGGDSFGEIVEAWEYDRLYFLTPQAEVEAGEGASEGADRGARGGAGFSTVLVRFGAHANPPTEPR